MGIDEALLGFVEDDLFGIGEVPVAKHQVSLFLGRVGWYRAHTDPNKPSVEALVTPAQISSDSSSVTWPVNTISR
jgi:hypothetical protein